MFELAAQTLISPPILFFVLGLLAAFVRSDLALPEALSKALALYLVMAIGFKGGAELTGGDFSVAAAALVAGVVLSAGMPLASFALLRLTTRAGRVDAAAIAAHYGSISIVTFIAARDALTVADIPSGGHMVAVAAAMEAPAIITGLLLAGRLTAGQTQPVAALSAAATPVASGSHSIWRDCFTNGSILLLTGSFLIGFLTGESGMSAVSPLFVDVFRGALCVFLLDMGLSAGRNLMARGNQLSVSVLAHAVYMPALGALLGLGAAKLAGLGVGDTALLMTLAASASYIAVPAALRLALPQAQLGLPLALSLGVTFPLNILVGIPVYITLAHLVS